VRLVGFLRSIVEQIRADLDRPDYGQGLASTRTKSPRSFREALREGAPRGALIAEFKRRSPGAEFPNLPAVQVDAFVRGTEAALVDGYSCLATRPEFGGSPADVAELRARTDRPTLFKDFVIDPRQLDAAARSGASAVLLIARLETEGLVDQPLEGLARGAHDRGLEVVLEWHDRAELSRTAHVPADVFGVNVRNLDSLKMDWPTAAATLRAAHAYRPLLGMSGVEGPREAGRFWTAGVDGLLVGSALARAEEPTRFLASLRRSAAEATR
jgi:indole-3-glycerol phosphate synthase